jgi:AcrR family transcriptional regulator
MPRTRIEAQYAANRQRILDEAAHLFAAKGFPRTTVVELANACQCSKALLYHYFKSKEEILYALLTTHLQHLRAVAEEALSVSDKPVEQFYALTQANMGRPECCRSPKPRPPPWQPPTPRRPEAARGCSSADSPRRFYRPAGAIRSPARPQASSR